MMGWRFCGAEAVGGWHMGEPDWLTDEIFTVMEFLDPDECRRLIELSEALGYEEALISTPDGYVEVEEVRNNERVIVDDPELAEALWELIEDCVPLEMEGDRAVGVNERFRFYRYDVGQQFDWHQDFSFERDNGERSLLTFMIYLNGGFEGGETSFNDSCSDEPFDEFSVTPEEGLALLFAHGVCHKGEAVTRGRKYVLRTDVMYAPRRARRKKGRRR
jgi:predicted 2-oxoglutarate/Fe(II)-dependent dioxygenase YbiX